MKIGKQNTFIRRTEKIFPVNTEFQRAGTL